MCLMNESLRPCYKAGSICPHFIGLERSDLPKKIQQTHGSTRFIGDSHSPRKSDRLKLEFWLCPAWPHLCMLGHRTCVWLCDPMDCSPPDSSVHGILRARRPEWVAFLLQGIFLTQELNLHLLRLLHWQLGSSPLEPLGSLAMSVPPG